jgi:hypothetical protein
MSASLTLTIEAKVLGQRRPIQPPWQATLAPDRDAGDPPTLRDLLAAVVRCEVAAFHERQERRRLERVLAPDEIERGAEHGKVEMGGRGEPQAVDAAEAVATAVQAFEDRLYLVFVDGRQVQELDERVALHEGSHLLFVRLVALIGG